MAMDQVRRTIVALAVLLGQGATGHSALLADGSASGLLRSSGEVAPGKPMVVVVPPRSASRILSVVVSISEPGSLSADAMLDCRVEEDGQGARCLLTKRLDLCDADLAGIVQQVAGTTLRIRVSRVGHVDPVGASDGDIRLAVSVADLGPADARAAGRVDFEIEPNDTPESANLLVLGRTVYGLADDRPYWTPEVSPAGDVVGPGIDWFRFQFDGPTPRLAYFALDFVDRDVPPDVRVYPAAGRAAGGIHPGDRPPEPPARAAAASGRQQVHHPRARARDLLSSGSMPASPTTSSGRSSSTCRPTLDPDEAATATPEAIAAAARKADAHGDGLPAPGRR